MIGETDIMDSILWFGEFTNDVRVLHYAVAFSYFSFLSFVLNKEKIRACVY